MQKTIFFGSGINLLGKQSEEDVNQLTKAFKDDLWFIEPDSL